MFSRIFIAGFHKCLPSTRRVSFHHSGRITAFWMEKSRSDIHLFEHIISTYMQIQKAWCSCMNFKSSKHQKMESCNTSEFIPSPHFHDSTSKSPHLRVSPPSAPGMVMVANVRNFEMLAHQTFTKATVEMLFRWCFEICLAPHIKWDATKTL